MNAQPELIFLSRDFSHPINLPAGLAFECERMSWGAIGGPLQSDWKATGSEADLWAIPLLLRCPALISHHGLVWWGFFNGTTLRLPGQDYVFSLDELANRIRISYNYSGPGTTTAGAQRSTAWAQDSVSVARYGTKELVVSVSDICDAAAAALLTQELDFRAKPAGGPSFVSGKRAPSASLALRGLWSTLDWRYAEVAPVAAISYTDASAEEQPVGTSSSTKIAQRITVSSPLNVLQITIFARKVGAPTDNLSVGIFGLHDPGHPQGSALVSANISSASLGATQVEVTCTFSERVIDPGNYAIQVSRSGSVDGDHYYQVGVNSAKGYAGGTLIVNNGKDWVARSPDADLRFAININEQVDTGTQISRLLTAYEPFVTGITVPTTGIVQGSKLDGSQRAKTVIENLMSVGKLGGRRLLATIDQGWHLWVVEEPVRPAEPYYQVTDQIEMLGGAPADLADAPRIVGNWAKLGNQPPGLELTGLDNQVFIESLEWTPASGLQPRYRGRPAPESMIRVRK